MTNNTLLREAVTILGIRCSQFDTLLRPCPSCGGHVHVNPRFQIDSDKMVAKDGSLKCFQCYRRSEMMPLGELVKQHNFENILTIYPAPRD